MLVVEAMAVVAETVAVVEINKDLPLLDTFEPTNSSSAIWWGALKFQCLPPKQKYDKNFS
jgi:hypothetical protein